MDPLAAVAAAQASASGASAAQSAAAAASAAGQIGVSHMSFWGGLETDVQTGNYAHAWNDIFLGKTWQQLGSEGVALALGNMFFGTYLDPYTQRYLTSNAMVRLGLYGVLSLVALDWVQVMTNSKMVTKKKK